MIFSGKTSGYFVEINEYASVVARTSSLVGHMVIEKIEEEPGASLATIGALFDKVAGPRRGGAYRHAVCGISPERRFIRRASLDPKRMKDTAFLEEVLVTQFRAEPEKMMIAILSASDGSAIDHQSVAVKEVVFSGSYSEDFS